VNIFKTKKDISNWKTPFFFTLTILSNKQQFCFNFTGTGDVTLSCKSKGKQDFLDGFENVNITVSYTRQYVILLDSPAKMTCFTGGAGVI